MQSIEHDGETKFHSVTNMNHKPEGETMELDEQVDQTLAQSL